MATLNVKRIAITICICSLTVAVCMILYRYDNKYTTSGPQGINGTLLLSETDISSCTFLVGGWAVYGGALLTPEDFLQNTPTPDAYVFIGQYGGFEKLIGSPHGSVTYRLVIGIPDELQGYMLSLPEIFSSCRVYVNGRELLSLGEIDPTNYRFETGNEAITFDAAGTIDLLIAVSDFTHLYSGIVYPPAIGETKAVSTMLDMRLFLRSIVLAVALIIGVVALLIGLLSGYRGLASLYGLLCLLFIGYTCYPITMTLTSGSVPLYAIENMSFCAILLTVIELQSRICHGALFTRKIRPYILGFGALVCFAALALPLISRQGNESLLMAYSSLITVYVWVTAGYITVTAGIATWQKFPDAAPLFYGMLVLDCTLVMDRILHDFEPILSGWFPELGSFVLILSVGMVTVHEIVRQYQENAIMEERVQNILSSGRDYYEKIGTMYDTIRILRHDYKYHLSTIRDLLNSGNQTETDDYLTSIEAQLSKSEIQKFCTNTIINALLASYAERCQKLNIKFDVSISLPDSISIQNYEMCIILGNLLENAVEACQKQDCDKSITLSIKPRGAQLAIKLKNSISCAILKDGAQLVSSKKDGGLGLRSIQAIAARYGGEMITEWDKLSFTAYVLMRL